MNPPQSKGTSIKHTAMGTMKGQSKGQSFRPSPSKRQREASSSVPPQPKRPRSTAPNVTSHTLCFATPYKKKGMALSILVEDRFYGMYLLLQISTLNCMTTL